MSKSDTMSLDQGGMRLDEIPDECPICHRSCTPEEAGVRSLTPAPESCNRVLEVVARCTSRTCGRYFIARYEQSSRRRAANEPFYILKETVPRSIEPPSIDGEIREVSASFAEIFSEASMADDTGLHHVAGCGYRKALEFLIKDYCISQNPEDETKIRQAALMSVICERIDHPRVHAAAKRAAWLGNDETHYFRKWCEHDITDLKKLIEITVSWIQLEVRTAGFRSEMPDSGPPDAD